MFEPANAEKLSPIHERVEQEFESREARVEKLTAQVETLFPGENNAELRGRIASTFEVPQYGKYHNEGMYTDTHLERILSTLDDMFNGRYPEDTSEATREVLNQAVLSEGVMMNERKEKRVCSVMCFFMISKNPIHLN